MAKTVKKATATKTPRKTVKKTLAKKPADGAADRPAAKSDMSDSIHPDILAYNAGQAEEDRAICETLASSIAVNLRGSECKVWHRHPVWFLDGNPIVGYSKLKDSVRLLFWSGQTFDEPGLSPEGSFKAAEVRYTSVAQISAKDLKRWLKKSADIQWDYKNIVKRKGRLERLK